MKYDVVIYINGVVVKDDPILHVLSYGNTWEQATADLKLYLLDGIPALIQLSQEK